MVDALHLVYEDSNTLESTSEPSFEPETQAQPTSPEIEVSANKLLLEASLPSSSPPGLPRVPPIPHSTKTPSLPSHYSSATNPPPPQHTIVHVDGTPAIMEALASHLTNILILIAFIVIVLSVKDSVVAFFRFLSSLYIRRRRISYTTRPDGHQEKKYEMIQLGRSTGEDEEEERRMVRMMESQPMAVTYENSRPAVSSVGYGYGHNNDYAGFGARSVGYDYDSASDAGSYQDRWGQVQVESPREESGRFTPWEDQEEEDVSPVSQLGRQYRVGGTSYVGNADETPRRRSARLAAKATQSL